MISKPLALAAAALLFVAACEEGAVLGSGTNTGIGATDVDSVATTPDGVVADAVSAPGDAGECQELALRIEDSEQTEVARQAAIEERQRLGCA
ncbi:hypothetical protein [Rubellimicrobium roseum]|uniref:Secreted protein n=1 Tax=Rubellimicrobium roseum TaxID=687525 RepID=A0A5C4NFH4_9RHOB|nr:hypothetical protein [Rubellimicrobium roseum]TNC71377.1 hypothetical protein FHG71_11520 [Rubellimicrobium roseum]